MNVVSTRHKLTYSTPIKELVRLHTVARKKVLCQKKRIELLSDKLRSRKETLVVKDGYIKGVLLQATEYTENNITDSK